MRHLSKDELYRGVFITGEKNDKRKYRLFCQTGTHATLEFDSFFESLKTLNFQNEISKEIIEIKLVKKPFIFGFLTESASINKYLSYHS